MKTFAFFLLFLPVSVLAQTTITGKVINTADNKPVSYASVFLSNTVVGTRSNDDGSFTLQNVKPGQYDLVVSFIGFETHHQTFTISNTPVGVGNIIITPKTSELKEVHIGAPDPNRNHYLDRFIHEFLGTSANAQQCKILNPDVINIDYDKATHTLRASSDDFIIVENKALGYKIHYQLTNFLVKYDGMIIGSYSTYYDGNVYFENLSGSRSQIKNWEKKRLETYLGSSMHFLRLAIANKLDTDGFKVLRLVRKPNPDRPDDSLLRVKMAKFSPQNKEMVNTIKYNPNWYANKLSDSAKYWRAKFSLPKTFEFLIKTPLTTTDFVKRINEDTYAITFADHLYIAYPKKINKEVINLNVRSLAAANYNTTIIDLNQKYAVFDRNGIFINPSSTTYDGAWGQNAVAELLPVDYVP